MVLREQRPSDYTDRKRKLADQGTDAIETWMRHMAVPSTSGKLATWRRATWKKVWQGDGPYMYRFVPRRE
jgi:hypothetical protein